MVRINERRWNGEALTETNEKTLRFEVKDIKGRAK
jgi:hypothetical protein